MKLSPPRNLRFATTLLGLLLTLSTSPASTSYEPQTPPAELSPTHKWLTSTSAQFGEAYENSVLAPFNDGHETARREYQAALDLAMQQALASGRETEAALIKNEKEAFFSRGRMIPSHASQSSSIEVARARFRSESARLSKSRLDAARRLHARFDAVLAQNIPLLQQRHRFAEATLLSEKRKEIAREWLESAPLPPASIAAGRQPITKSRVSMREAFEWFLEHGGKIAVSSGKTNSSLRYVNEVSVSHLDIALVRLDDNGTKGVGNQAGFDINDQDMDRLASLLGTQKLLLRGRPFTDRAFDFLEKWRSLEHFEATRLQTSDRLAERLAKFPMLESVSLATCETITDEFVRFLCSENSRLESLHLPGTAVGDAGVQHLRGFKRLTSLDLSGTRITQAGLKQLAAIKTLRELDIRDTKVAMSELQCLSGLRLSALGFLSTDSPEFATEATQVSRLLPLVESLTLSGTVFQPAHAEALKAFGKLRVLSLKNCKPTPEGLASLQKIRGLEEFVCSCPTFGDSDLKALTEIKHLKKISLSGTSITDTGLLALAQSKGLRTVVVSATAVTDPAIKNLEKAVHGIKVNR